VPPDATGAVAALFTHAVSRGKGYLHQLPQSTRFAESKPTSPS
jgi:hypothetical protein